jgi:hypothetical protein
MMPTAVNAIASVLLAQLNLGDPASVRPLPARPFLSHLFFENPMPLVGVFLVASVVVFFTLNARNRPQLGAIAGLLLATLAGGFYSLGKAVKTELESLDEESERLVDAAARGDARTLEDILAPDAKIETTLNTREIPAVKGREAVVNAVRSTLGGTFTVKDHAVLETQATLVGPEVGQTQVRVRATPSGGMYEVPVFSWWRLDWRHTPESGWRVTTIEPLAIWFPGVGKKP